MLRKIAPILPACNISETNLFYKDKLKFQTQNYGNYLLVKKDQVEIHYYECPAGEKFVASSCYLFDDNIQDLFAKFSSMDIIDPTGNLKENIWGKKEFYIMDNNGNLLKFGEI